MSRKTAVVLALMALFSSVAAAGAPDKPAPAKKTAAAERGSISGKVLGADGTPQMAAVIDVFNSAAKHIARILTDEDGSYVVAGLKPGSYTVQASARSFIPARSENIAVQSGGNAVVDLTLGALFNSLEFKSRSGAPDEEDDWKWTLRSSANRPLLRVVDVSSSVESQADEDDFSGTVAFISGNDSAGYASDNAVTTAFNVEQSLFSSGKVSFNGSLGPRNPLSTTVLRAAYAHQFASGSTPEVALTWRRFATPGYVQRDGALEAIAFSVADELDIADVIELRYGGEMQAIQYGKRVSAFRPFASAGVYLFPDTVLRYQFATSQPNTRFSKGFDTAPADLSESGPHATLENGRLRIERAKHQELSISRKFGGNNFQVAVYHDDFRDTALDGLGLLNAEHEDFLPDVYSGTFSYNGGSYTSNGVRVVYQRELTDNITASASYATGDVITTDLSRIAFPALANPFVEEQRHTISAKFSGEVPGVKTRWIASYKWISGDALTPVDAFDNSPGQTDPYLSVFVRQPIPMPDSMPGTVEALVDVRNLLAEGYVPMVGPDGQVLCLVQSPRSLRGGLAFSF